MKELPYPSGIRSADGDPSALFFVSLGGAGEIGMNLNLYGYAGDWLILDCGVTFGDDSQPGLEVVMPDPAFIVERRDRLLGIVATHAHEDHIGAIPYLWTQLRCPVWATPFTASLLRAKLAEAGLADKVRINVVPMSGRFTIGPFDLELITLTHSIPEPNAVALRTPVGTVLHTGDWKFDPDPLIGSVSDEAALRRLGDQGVLAMIGDSTNALRPGTSGSEADLRRSLIDLVGRYDARVAVACFASNVARLETIARAAAVHGRDVALVGRSLWRIDKAARENGYLADLPRFLTEDEAGYIPRDKIVLICTGSQGEPRAALARIAREDHPNIVLETGDVVIFSSRIIPGNEKSINRLQNALVRLGIEIITEEDHFVHVSGHPARDELVRMYQMVRPRVAIPVHGEARHLIAHAHLAEQCQVQQPLVIQNGDMVRLTPSGAAIVDEVPVGRLASDGKGLLPLGGTALKERRRLVLDGSAVATLVLDRQGRLVAPAAITVIGLVEAAAATAAAPVLSHAVERALSELPAGARRDDNAVRDAVRRTLRRAINERFGKRPLIELHLVRV
ncbi:MAG TPA: ribonuclease J [Stellaceae bacterium]|nr:ribonuclease J [Stellaceae bacterium]HMD65559.1 ribonuclease J [Stellaceae bacterium]